MPTPMRMFATTSCHTSCGEQQREPVRDDERDRAEDQEQLRPDRPGEPARRTGESTIITMPGGHDDEARRRAATARIRPPATGSSSICGYATLDANSEKPIATDARLVSSTGRRAATRRSSSGSAIRSSNHPHSRSTTSPPRPNSRHGRRGPAPVVAARDREQDAEQTDAEPGGADVVEAPRGAQHAHRHDPQHEREHDHPESRPRPRTGRASRCAR